MSCKFQIGFDNVLIISDTKCLFSEVNFYVEFINNRIM